MEEFDSCEWSPSLLRSHAARFDIRVFRERFRQLLEGLGVNLDASQFDPGRDFSAGVQAMVG
jgi:hypothetical protein